MPLLGAASHTTDRPVDVATVTPRSPGPVRAGRCSNRPRPRSSSARGRLPRQRGSGRMRRRWTARDLAWSGRGGVAAVSPSTRPEPAESVDCSTKEPASVSRVGPTDRPAPARSRRPRTAPRRPPRPAGNAARSAGSPVGKEPSGGPWQVDTGSGRTVGSEAAAQGSSGAASHSGVRLGRPSPLPRLIVPRNCTARSSRHHPPNRGVSPSARNQLSARPIRTAAACSSGTARSPKARSTRVSGPETETAIGVAAPGTETA